VVGAGRVARRGADATVFLGDQLVVAQALVAGVAPQVGAHAVVQPLGAGLGQAVGQRLERDGAVVVVLGHELGHLLFHPDAGGDGEGAQIILDDILASSARGGSVSSS